MMNHFPIIIVLVTLVTCQSARLQAKHLAQIKEDSSLVMVHVLFRHGQRTPDVSTIYPKDPYRNETYYPYGLGSLTNEGKLTQYRIGGALRERYNDFLGSYTLNKVYTLTSPFKRTKISALLVLAALFPPVGIERWNHRLNWQPIDYDYNPRSEDLIFLHGINCQRYIDLSNEQLALAVDEGSFGNYQDIAEYLSYYSGWNASNPEVAFNIYAALLSEEEWGFELPEWTNVVYPEPLHTIAVQYLAETVKTDILKKLSGGFILRRIVEETSLKLEDSPTMTDRRINLYSGHDFTIIALLSALGVYKPHQPTYGSYVILEVHKIGNRHGIKVSFLSGLFDENAAPVAIAKLS
ncbi:acid phosphatase-related [Holotrichia oblita]|uniref:Acid phosphatase-related n=2 Tax=Holotrichia oblita TaxID=644536 RepID=A0ACB9SWH4_HOLOL|nr:acid phosphatase-related [Holotrichia oblita]KAI4458931.1 acid phosphatase-related [Holotrichia oblita]